MGRVRVGFATLGLMTILTAQAALGWSGGPLLNTTDLAATCAVCHSSVGREQLRTDPPGLQNALIVENRHYKAIEEGTGAYQAMSPADRQRLLADIRVMDQNAAVSLTAPESARPGQELQVTVTAKGGNGVIGVALMDTDLRSQGRPIQGDGWVIVGAPKVWDSDGKEQTGWIDRRDRGLRNNINSAVIFDKKADIAAKQFAAGKATWTLRAPQEPGTYSIAAVMFYGTEKPAAGGAVKTPTGELPKGGNFGSSGRILFAKPVIVTVR